MTKQKVGLVLFCVAGIWAIIWGLVVSLSVTNAMHLTIDEVSQTMWALDSPLFPVWGLLGVPLGALVAGIGILLYSGATAWKYGLVIFIGIVLGVAGMNMAHIAPLFGIGGSFILLSFLGILWFWAKERRELSGTSATVTDLRMAGYVFMVIGAWFSCGKLSEPFLEALEGMDPTTPLHIMIFFVLGWVCFFLSHYKARTQEAVTEEA